MTHPDNELSALKRRVARAKRFPTKTCPASRHVHMMALALALTEKASTQAGLRNAVKQYRLTRGI